MTEAGLTMIASLWIACKFDSATPPPMAMMVYLADQVQHRAGTSSEQLTQKELEILTALEYRVFRRHLDQKVVALQATQ
jgi:hypothetical protein